MLLVDRCGLYEFFSNGTDQKLGVYPVSRWDILMPSIRTQMLSLWCEFLILQNKMTEPKIKLYLMRKKSDVKVMQANKATK